MTCGEALEILGLDSDASLDETREAYRTLVKHYHPDKNAASNASALKVLIHTVSTHKDDDFIPLTEDDYDSLVMLLGELTDVVRNDENHFFAPLMEFILVLIEKYDHAHNPELAARIQKDRVQNASNMENDLVAG